MSSDQTRPDFQEARFRLYDLEVRIHPDHIKTLQDSAAYRARVIRDAAERQDDGMFPPADPMTDDTFAMRVKAPHDMRVYGQISALPQTDEPLARQFMQPGARINFLTALKPKDLTEIMRFAAMNVYIRVRPASDVGTGVMIEMTDPRRICEIRGTKEFKDAAHATTVNAALNTQKMYPCEICTCDRRAGKTNAQVPVIRL